MAWTRLIRFVAAETKQIHIGEPVDPKLDIGLAVHGKKQVQAYEIHGSALNPNATVTKRILTVAVLLEPLAREEIKLVRALGLNFGDHAAEANLPKPPVPVLFYKPVTALTGPLSPITIPRVGQPVKEQLPDWEVEFTIVIGKHAKDVKESEALDYVLGYTVGNDISFRKHQMTTSQWNFSKGFDNTNPIGPVLVSARAIPDPQNVAMKTWVNGKVLQNGNTATQLFTVAQTIAFLSQGTTLEPGSIIMTGTPAGTGFARKPPMYLKNGDEVKVWIEGIGTLINQVVEEPTLKARL
ncbi:hypothetical protein M422DRAFT_73092 [Sphaerobolus stellatus SS14]|nr:hypothetical protein M422DRAFT_73092 [Sphaerobolus stellatus SS14]